jgi:hypothetical protein
MTKVKNKSAIAMALVLMSLLILMGYEGYQSFEHFMDGIIIQSQ